MASNIQVSNCRQNSQRAAGSREQEEEIGKLVSVPKGSCPGSFGAVVTTGLKGQISKLSKEALS